MKRLVCIVCLVGVVCLIVSCLVFKKDAKVVKLSELMQKIDTKSLLSVPLGSTVMNLDLQYHSWYEGVTQVEIPREWSEGAKCAALRVSHVLVDNKKKIICGAMGSNVYPTIAEGAFAMTNQIFAAVAKVTGGNAMVVPPNLNKKGKCMEMIYWWKPDPKSDAERELLVRAYSNNKRQMAVCTFIHTKGDGLTAAFGDMYTPIEF